MVQAQPGSFRSSFEVYRLTPEGRGVLAGASLELSVPALARMEQEEAQKREERAASASREPFRASKAWKFDVFRGFQASRRLEDSLEIAA